jgi:hypothetical protein
MFTGVDAVFWAFDLVPMRLKWVQSIMKKGFMEELRLRDG